MPVGDRHLSVAERAILSARAQDFHDAWAHGDPGDWERFLAGLAGHVRAAVVTELAIVDLGHRWKKGERPRVEEYLARFPEIGPPEAVPVALVVEEYRCRVRAGEPADPDQYRPRFPARYTDIRAALNTLWSVRGPTIDADPGRATVYGTPMSTAGGSAALTPSTAGSITQQYERVRKLGEGAFAEVWEVIKHPSGIRKAMKIAFQPADGRSVQRELKSLEAVKNLHHPALLATEDFWIEDNKLYVILELADYTLRGRMDACRQMGHPGIPADELIGYLLGAAEGLDYLHNPDNAPRVIHRDVKPDNILITKKKVKVADFGLARQQHESLAQQSMMAGTLLYMAPEVYAGDAGTASDQYSLAFSYVECRQGRPPLPASNFADLLEVVQSGRFDLDPCIGDEERAVLLRALARKPKDRYATCSEFAHELAAALGYHIPGTKPHPIPSKVISPPRERSQAGVKTDAAPPPTIGMSSTGGLPSGLTPVYTGPSVRRPVPPPASKAKLFLAVGLTVALLGLTGAVVWLLFGGNGNSTLPTTVATDPGTGQGGDTGKGMTPTGTGKPPAIEPPPPVATVLLPPRAVKAPGTAETELVGGRRVYDRIVFPVGGAEVPFRLITATPVPFYLGESKVWNRLYDDASAERGLKPAPHTPGDPDGPAMGVTAPDAEAFAAAVFGGHLPTPAEWDDAAGLSNPAGRTGPTLPGGQARLGRKEPAPVHGADVGTDTTATGLYDMAGNGREWTRAVLAKPARAVGDAPLAPTDLVILRGRAFFLTRPLTYDLLRKEHDVPQTQLGTTGSPYTAFRVAVPVPAK